ncbi:RteC domain-containing protein [Bacteroides oleiciplenus]|nr:RteC domain-containing protein [Bacteroides oleiciplenus]
MDYLILTETEFFHQITDNKECCNMETAYNEFVKEVFRLCSGCRDLLTVFFTAAYTETELQYLCEQTEPDTGENRKAFYIRKALSLLRKTLKRFQSQVPPLTSTLENPLKETSTPTPFLRWTGNAVDLVEVIYGLDEMGCINNGDVPLGELAAFFYTLLGVESKECYRFYTDIKHRKNESRTYFMDKMRERLNERMRRDDEKEVQRR